MKLVGTTKPTIQSIRDRTHWNSANIKPVDPVTLGLCKQTELDAAVQKAARRVERERKKAEKEAIAAGTLLPASETVEAAPAEDLEPAVPNLVTEPAAEPAAPAETDLDSVFGSDTTPAEKTEPEAEEEYDADSVFLKLKDLKIEE